MTWDTPSLAVDGTLKIVSGSPAPQIGGITVSQGNVLISGAGGATGGIYYVLTSSDVALPENNWTRLATNVFGAGGGFSFTNAVNPNAPQQFFLLQLP